MTLVADLAFASLSNPICVIRDIRFVSKDSAISNKRLFSLQVSAFILNPVTSCVQNNGYIFPKYPVEIILDADVISVIIQKNLERI